ncbi:glutamate receptor ionotropic, kainate 2-like isoform X2 [Oratosquilla oratoria]|uniref:glutamate receptor ionotropic, kainate 2-like isoform X2 n=1 Tax=Oratosquilla oratoria TaxID=337810 RepID=UPI003F75A76A
MWFLGGMWVLTTLIIATVYKSNLKAMLISPKMDIPFNNFEELVERNNYPWRVYEDSIPHTWLKLAKPGTFMAKARERAGLQTVNNPPVGVAEVANGDYAMIFGTPITLNLLQLDYMMLAVRPDSRNGAGCVWLVTRSP